MIGRRVESASPARRRFLWTSGALALLWLSGLAGRGLARTRPEAAAQLETLFRSPRSARALGRRYLAARPEAADPRVLLARLGFAGEPLRAAALRARFATLREADFAQGRTVCVDGWILAQSEADVCALLSLG